MDLKSLVSGGSSINNVGKQTYSVAFTNNKTKKVEIKDAIFGEAKDLKENLTEQLLGGGAEPPHTMMESVKPERFIHDREISRLSDFTRHHRCLRCFIGMVVFIYVAAIIALQVYEYLSGELIDPKQTSINTNLGKFNWLYLLYIPAL